MKKITVIHNVADKVELVKEASTFCKKDHVYFVQDHKNDDQAFFNDLNCKISRLKRELEKEKQTSQRRLEGLRYFQAKRKGII